jgi:hypothetical protein
MQTFYEVKPFLWQEADGHDRIQATVKNGRVERWSADTVAPIFIYERAHGVAGSGMELPLTIAALALLALTMILWPVAALVRRHYQRPFPYTGRRATAHRLVRIAALVGLAAIGLWLVVFMDVMSTNGVAVEFALHCAQAVSLIGFLGGLVVAVWHLTLSLKQDRWPGKLFAVGLTAAFAVMLWISLNYHLIGFSGQY